MKTAEEILDKYYKPKMRWRQVNRKNVIAAMLEYAEQQAKHPSLIIRGVIGEAFVRGQWKDVELIDESKVELLQQVRVIWRDEQNRRVTSFVSPGDVKKHPDGYGKLG